MIDAPVVTRSEAVTTAVIHVVVPRPEIQKVMDPAIKEVMATLAAQGIRPAGPLCCHHLRIDPKVFDFEVGFPVNEPVAPTGRVAPGRLPAATVVRTVYHGGYEGLGAAWGQLTRWIQENGHEGAASLWERYLAGPESGSDPAKWRTELNRALVEA